MRLCRERVNRAAEAGDRIASARPARGQPEVQRERVPARAHYQLVLQRTSALRLELVDQPSARGCIEWRYLERGRLHPFCPGLKRGVPGEDPIPGHQDDPVPGQGSVGRQDRVQGGGEGIERGVLHVVPHQRAASRRNELAERPEQSARLHRRMAASERPGGALEDFARPADTGQRGIGSRRQAPGGRLALHHGAHQLRLADPERPDHRGDRIRFDERREPRCVLIAPDQLGGVTAPSFRSRPGAHGAFLRPDPASATRTGQSGTGLVRRSKMSSSLARPSVARDASVT